MFQRRNCVYKPIDNLVRKGRLCCKMSFWKLWLCEGPYGILDVLVGIGDDGHGMIEGGRLKGEGFESMATGKTRIVLLLLARKRKRTQTYLQLDGIQQ